MSNSTEDCLDIAVLESLPLCEDIHTGEADPTTTSPATLCDQDIEGMMPVVKDWLEAREALPMVDGLREKLLDLVYEAQKQKLVATPRAYWGAWMLPICHDVVMKSRAAYSTPQ